MGQLPAPIAANAAEMWTRETGPKLLFRDSEIFRSRSSTAGSIFQELKVEFGVSFGSQSDLMRRPIDGRWVACGRFAEPIEEQRMWIEVERSRGEIRRENRRFAVQLVLALAAALAAGVAIDFFAPFHA
jgi:hypothetical protein